MSGSRDELTILNKSRMHVLISDRIWSVNGRRAPYCSGQGWKARLEGGRHCWEGGPALGKLRLCEGRNFIEEDEVFVWLAEEGAGRERWIDR